MRKTRFKLSMIPYSFVFLNWWRPICCHLNIQDQFQLSLTCKSFYKEFKKWTRPSFENWLNCIKKGHILSFQWMCSAPHLHMYKWIVLHQLFKSFHPHSFTMMEIFISQIELHGFRLIFVLKEYTKNPKFNLFVYHITNKFTKFDKLWNLTTIPDSILEHELYRDQFISSIESQRKFMFPIFKYQLKTKNLEWIFSHLSDFDDLAPKERKELIFLAMDNGLFVWIDFLIDNSEQSENLLTPDHVRHSIRYNQIEVFQKWSFMTNAFGFFNGWIEDCLYFDSSQILEWMLQYVKQVKLLSPIEKWVLTYNSSFCILCKHPSYTISFSTIQLAIDFQHIQLLECMTENPQLSKPVLDEIFEYLDDFELPE